MTKRKYKGSILVQVFLMLAFCMQAFAAIKLPAIFSDHMVMQQKSKAAVWGWGKPGEKVTVVGSWSSKTVSTTTGSDGKWQLELNTSVAGGPYTVKVSGENTIELKDVLIGEVWIASGQSNMATTLKPSYKGAEEVAKADHPNIRHFSVKRQYGLTNFDDAPGTQWVKFSPETASLFSAVAYYFAKNLQDSLKVPVGIIYNAWGGTPAEAWTPHDVLEKDPALSVYIDRWKKILENAGKDSVKYNKALKEWEQKNVDTTKKGAPKKPAEPQSLYYFKRPWREPGVLFNGMLNPVIPYNIKGVLWYQGESNVAYADEYEHLLTTMIDSWRNAWKAKSGTKDFSFYVIQISANDYNDNDAAARLREAQQKVADKLKNSGIAITLDLGDMKDIHYTHKREVGERLVKLALNKDYGRKDIVYTGPRCKNANLQGNKIIAQFDQQLLVIDGQKPGGFELGYKVAGSDSLRSVKAEIEIEGDKATLWNDKVANPVIVRYAWLLVDKANIMNKQGLPAPPFRMNIKK